MLEEFDFEPENSIDFIQNEKPPKPNKKYKHISIRGGLGTGQPIVNESLIWFNGDNNKQENFETFCIKRDDNNLNSCKTNHQLYDLLVCAVLILYKYHFGSRVEISSCGGLGDWNKAFKLVNHCLPYNINAKEWWQNKEGTYPPM